MIFEMDDINVTIDKWKTELYGQGYAKGFSDRDSYANMPDRYKILLQNEQNAKKREEGYIAEIKRLKELNLRIKKNFTNVLDYCKSRGDYVHPIFYRTLDEINSTTQTT